MSLNKKRLSRNRKSLRSKRVANGKRKSMNRRQIRSKRKSMCGGNGGNGNKNKLVVLPGKPTGKKIKRQQAIIQTVSQTDSQTDSNSQNDF